MDQSDSDARFIAFVAANREQARRTAWRLTGGDEAAADDVVQEALAKAHAGLAKFRDDSELSTWFYSILVRQARSYLRWRRVREFWGGLPEESEAPEVGREATRGDPLLRDRISEAVLKLSNGQRDAFVLVHLEGFTVAQAAAATGRAEGTLKSHLARALKSLRRDLADLELEAKEVGHVEG